MFSLFGGVELAAGARTLPPHGDLSAATTHRLLGVLAVLGVLGVLGMLGSWSTVRLVLRWWDGPWFRQGAWEVQFAPDGVSSCAGDRSGRGSSEPPRALLCGWWDWASAAPESSLELPQR